MERVYYRDYLEQSIKGLEDRCCEIFRCYYFSSAYLCRSYLSKCGFLGVKTVYVGCGLYLPMSDDFYSEWRRLNRQLKDFILNPKYD